GAVFVRAKRADRPKMIWWDGTGLVMAYKRLEQSAFKWLAIKDGVLRLDAVQFEALFAGLDWRRVTALETNHLLRQNDSGRVLHGWINPDFDRSKA
ncbi:MAG: IS66 family insertion sequence element accessory protein TnpB, partial [Lentilitoribacter sp.]